MKNRSWIFGLASCLALLLGATAARADVYNVSANYYGFAFPTDPAPVPGQVISPFSNAPGGALLQVTLGAGTYNVSNASGMAGADADFTAWRFNDGANWVWSFVLANDANHQVVYYADRGGVQNTQDGIASQAEVQDFSDSFTLTQTTTLDLMIRDYYLGDNAGGVSLNIAAADSTGNTVPEPGTLGLVVLGVGFLLVGRSFFRSR